MEEIRTFVAVEMPPLARAELGLVSEALAGRVPPGSVRWVRPELIHLTLRFLGETAVSQLPAISATLDEVGRQARPLTLHLGSVGCFPNCKRPRVIWVGLEGELPALAALQRRVEEALVPLGWAVEKRPFQPHLTLGRVKDVGKLSRVKWDVAVQKVEVAVTAVCLIESQLQPAGPIYTVRHRAPLKGS
jgi:RNA 2',3'-cyclic 3'-phosphodiesterase